MSRVKAWVTELLTKREAVERAIGMPLGNVLGCGHWGCVFDSTPPWVVKLSIDPTEGPIWSKIAGLVRDEEWGTLGFTEIKSIHRITPDITYGGKRRKVWAIVREGVTPVYNDTRSRVQRTEFTEDVLARSSHNEDDFERGMEGLRRYKTAAADWHAMHMTPRSYIQRRVSELARAEYGSIEGAEQKMQRILDGYFHGGLMAPLGESLNMLAAHGVYLRDVHSLNIGWHAARDDNDWDRVVIFDPGHTPTDATEGIEEALVQNGRAAL